MCGPWPGPGSVNVIRTKPDVDAASIRLGATVHSHPAAAVSSLMGNSTFRWLETYPHLCRLKEMSTTFRNIFTVFWDYPYFTIPTPTPLLKVASRYFTLNLKNLVKVSELVRILWILSWNFVDSQYWNCNVRLRCHGFLWRYWPRSEIVTIFLSDWVHWLVAALELPSYRTDTVSQIPLLLILNTSHREYKTFPFQHIREKYKSF